MVGEGNEMLGTTPHTISFSDLHWKLVEKLAKEHRMKFAEVNRKIYDFAIDHDPELGLPFLTDKRKVAQAEVAATNRMIRELEAKQKAGNTEPPKAVFETPISSSNRNTTSKALCVDKRPGQTEKDRFLKQAPYVADGNNMVTPELKKKVLTQATERQEWLEEVPELQRNKLRAMLGSVSR
jgi:hypothetical protein